AGLCDRFWEEVHPQAPDGDFEERIGNLSWLLTNSLQWLRAVPIIVAPQGRFSLADFEHAHARANSSEDDDGRPGLDILNAARRDTQHGFYRQLADDLPRLRSIRADLRQRMARSTLCDAERFASNFIRSVRQVWQEHVRGSQPASDD
ncbi:MAG: type VI secretion system ImpA family N-terminal domain-containing protein, partial [Pirellulaceae bacterium]